MKYPALFALLLAAPAFAESPTGFLEIPFGASLEKAKETLADRPGMKAGAATAERLTYTGGDFAGQPAAQWTLLFPGGKFASGSVAIDDVKKPVYDDLKAQLTKKYGKPDSEKGHHSFECLWEFPSDGRREVRLDFDYKGKVIVTYSHGKLVKAAPVGKKSDL